MASAFHPLRSYVRRFKLPFVCVISFIYPDTCGPNGHGSRPAAVEAAPVLLLKICSYPIPNGVSIIVGSLISSSPMLPNCPPVAAEEAVPTWQFIEHTPADLERRRPYFDWQQSVVEEIGYLEKPHHRCHGPSDRMYIAG